MYQGTLPATSNRETWQESMQAIDHETNEPFDLSDVDEITIQVRRDCSYPDLSGTLTGGEIEFGDTPGVFTWTFTHSQMSRLCAGTYSVGITATVGDEVIQLAIASLPVVEGIVR